LPYWTVGLRRVLSRVRPDNHRPSDLATNVHRRSLSVARELRGRVERAMPGRSDTSLLIEPDAPTAAGPAAHVAQAGTSEPARRHRGAHPATLIDQLSPVSRARRGRLAVSASAARNRIGAAGSRTFGRERALPITVAGLVLIASIVSVAPATGVPGSTDDSLDAPRLVVGGGVLAERDSFDGPDIGSTTTGDDAGLRVLAAELGQPESNAVGQYLADGTLLKPIAVDTSVPDAADRLQLYRVRSGDTLTGIAHKFGLSMMTIWWANKLTSKDALHVGQQLIIPPVDGLVVTVKAGDTLDSIAARTGGQKAGIMEFNGLTDETVVIGQTLMVPDVLGAAIATPTPAPATSGSSSSHSSGSSGSTSRPPSTYSGGKLYFPLPGHRITQYYHYGHYGIDIDGNTGDRVFSAAKGTVIYAGWKNNGGGNVVWIAHGSGLYTTYNHMSSVLVHRGQTVSRGQVVGRVGATGWATGSHLHFEVWKGGAPLWPDRRVNPLKYF
jgi:murein DD-endopeptidase MepM/ murein hydrolase activator NlpD